MLLQLGGMPSPATFYGASLRTTPIPLHHNSSSFRRCKFVCFSAAANNLRRRRRRKLPVDPNEHGENDGEIVGGVVGHALQNALVKRDEPPPPPHRVQPVQNRPSNSKTQVEELPLDGSDVLLALQKRASNSSRRRKKKRTGGRDSSDSDDEDKNEDYSEEDVIVRPLNIKSDWGSRLDQMESRLRELLLLRRFNSSS